MTLHERIKCPRCKRRYPKALTKCPYCDLANEKWEMDYGKDR